MKILIAGAGEVGSHLAKMLGGGSHEITVIDSDSERLQKLSDVTDVVTIEGSPSSVKVLKAAGIQQADLFIAVYPAESQDVNIVAALLAKKLGARKVTCRIDNEELLSYDNRYMFTEMGVDLLFYPERIAATEILDLLNRNASSDSMDFAHGKLQMVVFKLDEDAPILDGTLREFAQNASGHEHFRVVAISRDNETIIPGPDTRFKVHDLVFIISKREGIESLMRYIGKSDVEVRSVMVMGGAKVFMLSAEVTKSSADICLGCKRVSGSKRVRDECR